MDLSPMQLIATVLGGGTGGSIITKALDVFGRRGRSQAYTMGAVDHAVQTAMGLVTDRLEVVERQHSACQADLQDVRAELAARKAEIDRLMQGPVAGYDAKPEGGR